MSILERVLGFFVDNFPAWQTILLAGPLGLAWAYACLHFAGYLKTTRGWRTGYTRKTFHFLIFSSVATVHGIWGTPAVCLFGGMTTLVVFYAVFRGEGHPLYEAMAREKDSPHRTYFVVIPYFATLLGGLVSNIVFGPIAVVGYLVTGFGDAIGEPVGTRFGRHPYRVPCFGLVRAERTLEGSAAVFVASIVAILLGMWLGTDSGIQASAILLIPVIALASALVESVSPHGWDNLTMQIIPTMLCKWAFTEIG